MKVTDVMLPFADSVHPDDQLRDAVEKLKALDLDPIPVTQGERFVGVLSSSSVAATAAESGLSTGSVLVRDVMSDAATCVRVDDDVEEALLTIKRAGKADQSRKFPVVDAGGSLVGTVSARALETGHEEEQVSDGTAAVFDVESISSMASVENDPVEFMDDESFPASDPPPSPGAFGPDERD